MINNRLQGTESRRNVVKKLLGGAAVLALAGVVAGGGLPNAVSADGVSAYYRTTAALNLRSQPSTTSSVILVIPYNALVSAVGQDQNGFKKVSYAGKIGWAHSGYLAVDDVGGGDMPAYRGVAATTGAANLRSGPGTQFGVLRVIPVHTTVEVYDEYGNYYWLVRYNGQFGYVHSSLLSSDGGPTELPMTTAAALNMRTQSNANGQLITVVPAGAQVIAGPAIENGYRGVTYGKYSGWVHAKYLK
jgi:uncharacterized protein YraI